MDLEGLFIKTETSTKENFFKEKPMEKAFFYILMEDLIKGISRMTKKMDLECKGDKINQFTEEITLMDSKKDMGSFFSLIKVFIKGISKRMSLMEKGLFIGKMEEFIWENGKNR